MVMGPRAVRYIQRNADRREIYLVTTADDGSALAQGPLSADEVRPSKFTSASCNVPPTPEGAQLAARLTAEEAEFHDLGDFYRFYGYPDDVIAWVESTKVDEKAEPSSVRVGRYPREVVERLGVDLNAFSSAAAEEDIAGWPDSEGNWVFHMVFDDNWALGSLAGVDSINPNALRFKAWLSFNSADPT